MIEKERLQELIEQGATIWFYEDLSGIEIIDLKEDGCKYEIGIVDADNREHLLRTSISKYGKSIDDWWWFSGLFETKEELDWYIEFGCIERTERLELPTWEEFDAQKFVWFFDKDHRPCCLHYLNCNNMIFVNVGGAVIEIGEYTKENYTIACRKCVELFK